MSWHLNENAWEYFRFYRENCNGRFAKFITFSHKFMVRVSEKRGSVAGC